MLQVCCCRPVDAGYVKQDLCCCWVCCCRVCCCRVYCCRSVVAGMLLQGLLLQGLSLQVCSSRVCCCWICFTWVCCCRVCCTEYLLLLGLLSVKRSLLLLLCPLLHMICCCWLSAVTGSVFAGVVIMGYAVAGFVVEGSGMLQCVRRGTSLLLQSFCCCRTCCRMCCYVSVIAYYTIYRCGTCVPMATDNNDLTHSCTHARTETDRQTAFLAGRWADTCTSSKHGKMQTYLWTKEVKQITHAIISKIRG